MSKLLTEFIIQFRDILLPLLLVCISGIVAAQDATVSGVVSMNNGQPALFIDIGIIGTPYFTVSGEDGSYSLTIPSGKEVTVVFTGTGINTQQAIFNARPGEHIHYNIALQPRSGTIDTLTVEAYVHHLPAAEKIDPRISEVIPSLSGFESILSAQALGVTMRSELSSQYTVRGGNFDENLVYVNGIQVFRPFLVHNGQQEGLSFINSELVDNAWFSAGGFEARYGDKMSSVLDITYKEPNAFAASFSASALGGSAHFEDASDNFRFTQLHGLRYRNNGYILKGLDTDGEYKPTFLDYQTYMTYDITSDLKLSFLGNIARNKFNFIPKTREAAFGTINQAVKLTVYFDGQEIDTYESAFGALSLRYTPRYNTVLNFNTSVFRTLEDETFDVEGAYRLSELNRNLGSEDFGDEAFVLGVGSYLDHARNYLDALVLSANHDGRHEFEDDKTVLLWGAGYRHDDIIDAIKEWKMLDSAGYSVPIYPRDQIVMNELITGNNDLSSDRITGYVQLNHDWKLHKKGLLHISAGVRSHYWSWNGQTTVSPRAQLKYTPHWVRKDTASGDSINQWAFRASGGYYHQPPFYREFRDFSGKLNPDIRAQTAIHAVLGAEHYFEAWDRPFKFVTEMYYKYLYDLIPYEFDNVRVRYYATNNAKGYAGGIDMKLNGQVVKGLDSWLSLSIMRTREDISDDYYYTYQDSLGNDVIPYFAYPGEIVDSIRHEPGFIPRPTDQLVTFAMFFQDYLPKHPNYKMHMNLLFGSGLPFGPPGEIRYRDTLRMLPYRRVDIGFSALLLDPEKERKDRSLFKHFNSIWATFEIFNLMQIRNTVNYMWVKDASGIMYAVPNYLTARRFNLKLIFKL